MCRFDLLDKGSGYAHISSLWEEARSQVSAGWLAEPVLLDDPSGPLRLSQGSVNVAFRFPAARMDQVRARGDFKYGRVNLAYPKRPPIALPTWDHIGQLCLDLRDAGRDWKFSKADHQDAYKNFPINPDQAPLTVSSHGRFSAVRRPRPFPTTAFHGLLP